MAFYFMNTRPCDATIKYDGNSQILLPGEIISVNSSKAEFIIAKNKYPGVERVLETDGENDVIGRGIARFVTAVDNDKAMLKKQNEGNRKRHMDEVFPTADQERLFGLVAAIKKAQKTKKGLALLSEVLGKKIEIKKVEDKIVNYKIKEIAGLEVVDERFEPAPVNE